MKKYNSDNFYGMLLCFVSQINEEFKRITTANLESTFMENLDQCIASLMSLALSRGGAAKKRIQNIMEILKVHDSIFRIKKDTCQENCIHLCYLFFFWESNSAMKHETFQ